MKFTISRDCASRRIEFSGEFDDGDIARLRLDSFDRALLLDIENGEPASAADLLLALEMLYRRFAEQISAPRPPA